MITAPIQKLQYCLDKKIIYRITP